MSHFTTVTLEIKNTVALKEALKRMFPDCKIRENGEVRGYYRATQKADIVLENPNSEYDIGFTLAKDKFNMTSDWWGSARKFGTQEQFTQKLKQNYAVSLTTLQAKSKGWFVKEEAKEDGKIRLTLTKF